MKVAAATARAIRNRLKMRGFMAFQSVRSLEIVVSRFVIADHAY